MQSERHLNNAKLDPAEYAEMKALGETLAADLARAAERPGYFWARQRAQVRARLVGRRKSIRWPIAALAALAVLSFALLTVKLPAPAPARAAQAADADDLLLKDIQHSLARRAPEPLMPASILVQEMTTGPNADEKRVN